MIRVSHPQVFRFFVSANPRQVNFPENKKEDGRTNLNNHYEAPQVQESIPSFLSSSNVPLSTNNLLQEKLEEFKELAKEMRAILSIENILDWDLQTHMPPKASEERGWLMTYTTRYYHEILISEKMSSLLKFLREESNFKELNDVDRALVKLISKEHDKLKNIPVRLMEEYTEVTTKAHHVWASARDENNFEKFAPYFEKIISIQRQMVEFMGYKGSPYNALLDRFEEGLTIEELDKIFLKLKAGLIPIIKAIKNSPVQIDTSFLNKQYSESELKELNLELLKLVDCEMDRGRLDDSAHPFTTTIAEHDIRLTSRYEKLWDSISTLLHEAGHTLYEQGVDPKLAKSLLAEGTSLGIHESQSRLYELMVGQSLSFWEYFFPKLQQRFPDKLSNVTVDEFYKAINKVQPIFIRNESDEVTYNLHVPVRYEIERDLIEGKLSVKDVPKAWNEKMQEYVGLCPTSDSVGALQDMHWSSGDIGYFPTYTLGTLYAAQFYNTAKKEIPGLEEEFKKGNFIPLKEWLKDKIHKYGRMETANEIAKRVTGESLNPDHFLNYIREKYRKIYNVDL
ncbi:MAG: carboxypeptidase M32 [Candidatus Melainabacteria bacterium]|nr:carboxypeptidase M32 [Candidatus Melainabacteria bacterium]